jgi:hypothetical protein
MSGLKWLIQFTPIPNWYYGLNIVVSFTVLTWMSTNSLKNIIKKYKQYQVKQNKNGSNTPVCLKYVLEIVTHKKHGDYTDNDTANFTPIVPKRNNVPNQNTKTQQNPQEDSHIVEKSTTGEPIESTKLERDLYLRQLC